MKLLLTSVFKPYGVDDQYGRKENIMELYHNQITREQGIFSLRYNHRSFGLYLMAENIEYPAVVLDFPTLDRFIKEIKKGYDYVGISFITPNFLKARKMSELIRKYSPSTKIILGGHGTQIPDIEKMIDCDYVARGEGVRWLRKLFDEKVDAPIKHPIIPSAENKRFMGIPLLGKSGILMPGVGCPNRCRFCCTTHNFRFEHIPFFQTGKELFDICVKMEKKFGCSDFFVMDENFLKNKKRAMELLDLMKKHDKLYYFGIFSSAEAIMDFGIENVFELGVGFLWLGVESYLENYQKNRGIDMPKLFSDLRNHGVSVLASSILFQEHHTKENIWKEVDYMKTLRPDFAQFMQLGPLPKTALYDEYMGKGKLCTDVPFEEWHGQHRIWFNHPEFTQKESQHILKEAFQRDFHELGPSIMRMCETYITGYEYTLRYQDTWKRKRNEKLREYSRDFYSAIDIMQPYLPNRKTAMFAMDIEERYRRLLGEKTVAQRALTKLGQGFAFKENLKLKLLGDVRQPSTYVTSYRKSLLQFLSSPLKGRSLPDMSFNYLELKLRKNLSTEHMCLELRGIMDGINWVKLYRRILNYLKTEKKTIGIDITKMISVEDDSLHKLMKKLKEYHSKIMVYYSEKMEGKDEFIARLKENFEGISFVEYIVMPVSERVPVPASDGRDMGDGCLLTKRDL
ncbi:MAG: radical SAM protein [Nitrospiraceae bacterium]|nr:MAG: radical SAM protein [Nitrospiraceae bacterium]